MRQPDNLPAFCRVHRNGRPLTGYECASSPLRVALRAVPDRPVLLGSLRRSRKPHRRAERRVGAARVADPERLPWLPSGLVGAGGQ
jgi:hypothetical protein